MSKKDPRLDSGRPGAFGLEPTPAPSKKGSLRRGRISSLNDSIVREVVALYNRGAKSATQVAHRLGINPHQLSRWLQIGQLMVDDKWDETEEITIHHRRCEDMVIFIAKGKAEIADKLRTTQLALACGVLQRDGNGDEIEGLYILKPEQKALDSALHNYDPSYKVPGKELVISKGEGWDAAAAAIAAANEGIPDDDDAIETEGEPAD